MSSSSSNVSPEPSLVQQFEHYIHGLIADSSHSQVQSSNITKEVSGTSDNINNSNLPFESSSDQEVLWVVDADADETIKKQLSDPDTLVVSIDRLDSIGLNQRYELICFWLPTFKSHEFKTYLPTLIRSRDMFSRYTIAILPPNLDLRPYGFTALSTSPLMNNRNPSDHTDLIAWQFNLYDYKPRPNWLNAHYWANPENWDKFRW